MVLQVKVMNRYDVEKLKLADAMNASSISIAAKHLAIGYLGSEKVLNMRGKKSDAETEIIDTLKIRVIYRTFLKI